METGRRQFWSAGTGRALKKTQTNMSGVREKHPNEEENNGNDRERHGLCDGDNDGGRTTKSSKNDSELASGRIIDEEEDTEMWEGEKNETGRRTVTQTSGETWFGALDFELNEEQVFGRRDSITRSPPIVDGGCSRDKKKRKADSSPKMAGQEEMTGESGNLRDMQQKIVELSVFAKSNRNVHKEVKRMAGELKSLIHRIKSEYRHLVGKKDEAERRVLLLEGQEKRQEKKGMEKGEKEESEGIRPTKKRSVAVQADSEDIASEMQERECDRLREIEERLTNGQSFKDIEGWLDTEWPENMYKNTKEIQWKMVTYGGADVAVLTDLGEEEKKGSVGQIIGAHPQIGDLVRENLNYGECEYLSSKTSTTTSRGHLKSDITRFFMVLPFKISKDGVNNMEEVYDLLIKMREVMIQHERKEVQIGFQKGINEKYARKLLEFVMRKHDISAEIITESKQTAETRTTEEMSGRARKERAAKNHSGLVLKAENKTFAELLREVRDAVDIDKVGVEIKTIKQTKKGDLYVRVEGDEKKAERLSAVVRECVENVKVIKAGREVEVNILDIDAITSEAEVLSAIEKNLTVVGVNKTELHIKSLRTNRDGWKMATVITTKNIADELTRNGRIKIGWVNCRVREKEKINRCYRCLELGHEAGKCGGVDRSKCCLKCGEEGHKVKDCKNEEKCNKCGKSGHRIDSRKCPAYVESTRSVYAKRGEAQRSKY